MIDLCIVTYHDDEKLKRLLLKIGKEAADRDYTIRIQDNASDPATGALLKRCKEGGIVDWYFSAVNVGYALACNRLVAQGEGDIIGILNSDVWMEYGDLVKIQQFFDDNPDVHIMGPKQRDEKGYITHAGIFGTNKAPKHRGWKMHDPDDRLYKDVVEAVTVSGSAYFIRREVWDALTNYEPYQGIYEGTHLKTTELLSLPPIHWWPGKGAFLPTPFYYEETFCSYYARHMGYKLVYNGEISIGHTWHGSVVSGSRMDQMFKPSSKMFAKACDALGIEHDQ